MAKSLVLACCVLLAAVAPAKDFSVTTYSHSGCTGTATTNSVPYDTCLPYSGGNFTASKFKQHAEVLFAHIGFGTGTNCNNLEPTYVPCGHCLNSNDPTVKYYRYTCSTKNKMVVASDECNSDCSDCGQSANSTVGQCQGYNNGTMSFQLLGLAKTPALFEDVYGKDAKGTCSVAPAISTLLPCGTCLNGVNMFNCTSTGGKGTRRTVLPWTRPHGRF